MSHWYFVRLVTAWEFRRYFKWKDQFLGLLIFLVISGISYATSRVAGRDGRPVTLATDGIEISVPAGGRISLVAAPADSAARATALREGDVRGILTRRGDGAFELLVARDPRYLPELRILLAEQVRRERLVTSGISESELARILAPPPLEVRFTDPDRARAGRAEMIAAGVFLGLVVLALFTSMAYLLTGITGEKQLRVTESITAIIPPQAWIDGKILGIGAYALTTTFNMVAGGLVLAAAAKLAWGFSIPAAVVRPGVILVLVLFSILALLLWNAFFAAFASTIDDPNTSTRSPMMFVPMLPVVLTISVLRDPDHTSSRVLSLVPLTSPSAMPARVLLSNPGVIEIAVSALLLVATIWLMRRAAGRIFEIGMLMYGKEPTLREIWRWASSKPGSR
jgi:ABC-2 type transport system permease protein